MPSAKSKLTGPKPGSSQSARAKAKQLDANIRQIFEEEAKRGDALRKALQYMAENDKSSFVYAYLKLLATDTTKDPIRNVTNVYAEQINAPRIVAHLEDMAERTARLCDASLVSDQPVLPADGGSETH